MPPNGGIEGVAAHVNGMSIETLKIGASFVNTIQALMSAAGATTSPVPGYDGLVLPNASTMDQLRWAGICVLAADSDFRREGAFAPDDVAALQREYRYWQKLSALAYNRPRAYR